MTGINVSEHTYKMANHVESRSKSWVVLFDFWQPKAKDQQIFITEHQWIDSLIPYSV
jgi:hypothetical protein